jgi:hypothetical protein
MSWFEHLTAVDQIWRDFDQDPTGISGIVLPQDATNSTRIDFQDPLLNKIMPLVSGGYIRIGGTYTVRPDLIDSTFGVCALL